MTLRSDKVFKPLELPVVIGEKKAVERCGKSFHDARQAEVLVLLVIVFHKIGFVEFLIIHQKYSLKKGGSSVLFRNLETSKFPVKTAISPSMNDNSYENVALSYNT